MEEERPLTLKNVLEEHKHIIISIGIIVVGCAVWGRGNIPWIFGLPLVYTVFRSIIEMAVSRFGILKFIGCAILIYGGVVWVLGAGPELSPLSRW